MRIRTLAGPPLLHELAADLSRVIVLADLTDARALDQETWSPGRGVALDGAMNRGSRP
ncbi:hypothetical protein [Rhodococcus sp. SORGH_AS_0301]|uniref:hypothetical protein n=1 Tax=Rhodococcus sp. SORGH_AS_0301 TaxID=3041780 RepID=UPI002783A6C4|nr:hypothetical protein [Rhodococcus sp. SORGH_AS_0301]MDQ1178567.1 hypothetical protein [Rhodococcus sp. SORGH_AS_0301]